MGVVCMGGVGGCIYLCRQTRRLSQLIISLQHTRPPYLLLYRCLSQTGDFCNIGAYGIPSSAYSFEPANRQLEALLSEHGGRKVLYSHAFYSRQDFYSRLYDGARYFRMRERYCAAPLPEMFDKVVTTSGQL